MDRLKQLWAYVAPAFSWLWGDAPEWRRRLVMFLLGVACMLLAQCAFATDKPKPADPGVDVDVAVEVGADAKSHADASSDSTSASELSLEQNYRAGPADLLLVPNENTEDCLRVFGFGGNNRSGGFLFGVPIRFASCDLDKDADRAFAQGNLTFGWMLLCKKRSNIRAFGTEEACLEAMTSAASVHTELLRLEREVLALREQNRALGQRFTPAEADLRCERKSKDCPSGK